MINIKSKKAASKVTFYGTTLKADTKMVVNDLLLQEDDFIGLYWSDKSTTQLVLSPPYNPSSLQSLVTRNNTLAQAIAAMEVNIDGTGWTIEPTVPMEEALKDGDDPPEKAELKAFFNEPYPDQSFVSMRRSLRYDLESTGNGYLEVLRNLAGEVVFLRYLDAITMRLCRLDDAVLVEKTIVRNGEEITASVWVRERRFVQKVGTKLVFFKEFGATRKLNRDSGLWVDTIPEGASLASEVLHFTCEKDVSTPYGIPRWINQMPSVLGSRKAEEFNLEFFDSGGIPPAAVFVQGGSIAPDVAEQLRGFFSGAAKTKHRVAVVEVQSTSGSLDSNSSVKVSTERFGDNKTDAMFQTYDKNCDDHVRSGFRLPPLFLGRSLDYNFATAVTAYMVTEAQVFQPERFEFDEIINSKIVRALGVTDWRFTSAPLTLKNVDVQLLAIDKVATLVDDEELVDTVNSIAGLNLKFSQEKVDAAAEAAAEEAAQMSALADQAAAGLGEPDADAGEGEVKRPPRGTRPNLRAVKSDSRILQLVANWGVAVGISKGDLTDAEKDAILLEVESLDGEDKVMFDSVLAVKSFVSPENDLMGLREIASCACAKVT